MEAHLNFFFKSVQPFSCRVVELWWSIVSVTWTPAPWKPHTGAVLAESLVDTRMCVFYLLFFSHSLTCRLTALGMRSGWCFSPASSLQPTAFWGKVFPCVMSALGSLWQDGIGARERGQQREGSGWGNSLCHSWKTTRWKGVCRSSTTQHGLFKITQMLLACTSSGPESEDLACPEQAALKGDNFSAGP